MFLAVTGGWQPLSFKTPGEGVADSDSEVPGTVLGDTGR